MKEVKYTILYCVLENLRDSILLRFRIRQGPYKIIVPAPVPLWQKVTVTIPVPQHFKPYLKASSPTSRLPASSGASSSLSKSGYQRIGFKISNHRS
jgi:hypothetical protein